MHDHENEQVCLVLEGELALHSEDGSSTTLQQYDSAWLESWETHAVENTGDEMAVGLDVFAPGRSFDFWTDREDEWFSRHRTRPEPRRSNRAPQ